MAALPRSSRICSGGSRYSLCCSPVIGARNAAEIAVLQSSGNIPEGTLVYNTDTKNLEVFSDSGIPSPVLITFAEDKFIPTSGQTEFNLSAIPQDLNSISVEINGVGYIQNIDFTVFGAVLTWLDVEFTLDALDILVVRYI